MLLGDKIQPKEGYSNVWLHRIYAMYACTTPACAGVKRVDLEGSSGVVHVAGAHT